MEYKKYSAFISSNYESLRSERIELINCLLDAQIIPICMEHFTATSSENFDYIFKEKWYNSEFLEHCLSMPFNK